jgi:hypothetical protein
VNKSKEKTTQYPLRCIFLSMGQGRNMMTEQLPEAPVGDQFNLEPQRPELYVLHRPPVQSQSIVSDDDYRTGSEFGGVAGQIQPPPHIPTAAERRRMVMFIDPTDPGTETGSVAAPELEGNF